MQGEHDTCIYPTCKNSKQVSSPTITIHSGRDWGEHEIQGARHCSEVVFGHGANARAILSGSECYVELEQQLGSQQPNLEVGNYSNVSDRFMDVSRYEKGLTMLADTILWTHREWSKRSLVFDELRIRVPALRQELGSTLEVVLIRYGLACHF